ncbi:MAG: hypothetical protein GIW99_09965 [Candidatus Eremiobacteraeota bacterium]|nr:hypothetical protein [Candidatus Eremiobacteraeota bacterium]MBC5827988.1 hypothetical protein [Candidatus Eremiobacteraeota bacterium]
METPQGPETVNPYHYQSDESLEVLARGAIDEAIARSAASPRSFEYYSMMAAKQIARYVLDNFERKKG